MDCSVAAKWALQESGRSEALHLLDDQESRKILLIAPDLLLAEFACLIAKRTHRKQMPAAQGYLAFQLMEESKLRLFERPASGHQAAELVSNDVTFSALFGHAPSKNFLMESKSRSGASIQGA